MIFNEDDCPLDIPDEMEQGEPVQIFEFPEDKTHERMAEQPVLLEDLEESGDNKSSEDENV